MAKALHRERRDGVPARKRACVLVALLGVLKVGTHTHLVRSGAGMGGARGLQIAETSETQTRRTRPLAAHIRIFAYADDAVLKSLAAFV
jgi:hypothetical protein